MIFANASDNSVIAIAQHKGSVHDFKIFKENFDGASDKIKFLADSGFQGILEFHTNSETPIKSNKKHKLTAEEKIYNHKLSMRRIFIEHINAWIKRFKILAYKYRNKRLRHGLRVSLICGIYNAMLGLWTGLMLYFRFSVPKRRGATYHRITTTGTQYNVAFAVGRIRHMGENDGNSR